jgi:hypothetical protein
MWKGSDDGVKHSESVRLWALSIVRSSKQIENRTFRKLDLSPFTNVKTQADPVYETLCFPSDRLCGLVVRVLATDPEARVRFPALPKKVVGLERGPLSLVSTTEELLGRKVAAPV